MADSRVDSYENRLAITRQIWGPIFSVIQNDTGLQVSSEQFLKVTSLYYEAFAEFLKNEEIMVMKEMYATSVGKKIAVNTARSIFQLEPFALTLDGFSSDEKAEWAAFAKENYGKVQSIKERMTGFIAFIERKHGRIQF